MDGSHRFQGSGSRNLEHSSERISILCLGKEIETQKKGFKDLGQDHLNPL